MCAFVTEAFLSFGYSLARFPRRTVNLNIIVLSDVVQLSLPLYEIGHSRYIQPSTFLRRFAPLHITICRTTAKLPFPIYHILLMPCFMMYTNTYGYMYDCTNNTCIQLSFYTILRSTRISRIQIQVQMLDGFQWMKIFFSLLFKMESIEIEIGNAINWRRKKSKMAEESFLGGNSTTWNRLCWLMLKILFNAHCLVARGHSHGDKHRPNAIYGRDAKTYWKQHTIK